MTPITRKENYLNEIVGWGETAPEKPLTPEEFFFAAILGEVVQTPEPLSRYQIYLAKIAGRNISVPKPLTRLELFLAKACGMDIETPTPITREEIFWSNYSAIVDFEVEGVPPLTYKAIEGTLENYRICGNTVGGESVGDKTENLFDGEFLQGYWVAPDGHFTESNIWICTKKIPCKANTNYTFSFSNKSRWYGIAWYDIAGNYIRFSYSDSMSSQPTIFTATSPANAAFMSIDIASDSVSLNIHPSDVTDFMLVEGSTALPYEPYGYKVPVTVSNGTDTLTTSIYLPEQIKKVGDEAEYIDYGEQKQHRVRKNLLPNTATSMTIEGVTVTVNEDGSITCNGTANSERDTYARIYIAQRFYFDDETIQYTLTGSPYGGSQTSFLLEYSNAINKAYQTVGNGVTFTPFNKSDYPNAWVRIKIYNGYTCNNLTFYPMIRKADIEDDTYEPYIEDTELDVTLPALPTLPGTNVLSVGTAVQPSKVYVKYRGERQ